MLFFATAALTGIIVLAIGWMVWKIRDFGRAWVFLMDEDGKTAKIAKTRAAEGKFILGKEKEYHTDGTSRYTSGLRSVYLIDRETGWPLRAPTRVEKDDFLKAMAANGEEVRSTRLRIQNPDLSYNVSRNTVRQRWLRSKEAKEDWRVKFAMPAMIVAIGLIAILGLFMWKYSSGAGH